MIGFMKADLKPVAIQKGSVYIFVLGTWRETKKSQERIERK